MKQYYFFSKQCNLVMQTIVKKQSILKAFLKSVWTMFTICPIIALKIIFSTPSRIGKISKLCQYFKNSFLADSQFYCLMRNSRKRKRSNDDSFTNNNRDFKEDSDRRKRRRVDGDGVRDDKREKNPRKRRREWRFSRAPSLMSITVPSEKEPEEKVELKIKKRRRKRQKHLHQEAVLQVIFSDCIIF